MKKEKDILIEVINGFYCVVNIIDRAIHIYYKDRKQVKEIGAIMNKLVEKSGLNHLELACFSLFIKQQNNLLTNIKRA